MEDKTVTQVWLSVHRLKVKDGEDSEPAKTDVILINDEEGIKLLFTLFKILKNEFIEIGEITDGTIFNYLKTFVKEFDRDNDLTEAIKKKIMKLERYNFYRSSEFVEITLEEILERIKSLRARRIELWKAILKSYVENKDEYTEKLVDHFKPIKFQD